MLFDITPEEPVRSKRPRKRATEPVPEAAGEQPAVPVRMAPTEILGRIDGTYECADEACGGMSVDVVDEIRGEWTLQCAFCGTSFRSPAMRGAVDPVKDSFVFHDGRFAGKTVRQAWREPRGEDYVRWAADGHPRQAVREACKKHLDSILAGA